MRYNKLAQDLKKKSLKRYNIQALWQQSYNFNIASEVNSPARLEQFKK